MTTTNRNGTGMSGMNEPMGSIDQKLDTIKEKARDFVDQGSEKVSQIKERVVDVKDRAMERGNVFLDRVTEMIKENPLRSVAIAFGIGYIGMRLFRR